MHDDLHRTRAALTATQGNKAAPQEIRDQATAALACLPSADQPRMSAGPFTAGAFATISSALPANLWAMALMLVQAYGPQLGEQAIAFVISFLKQHVPDAK